MTARSTAAALTGITRHVVLIGTGVVVLAPFVWMVSLSLKPPGEIFRATFSLLPERWYAVQNYSAALTSAPLPRFMLNGVLICGSILALQLLFCAPAAYALAKLEFRGRNLLFGLGTWSGF